MNMNIKSFWGLVAAVLLTATVAVSAAGCNVSEPETARRLELKKGLVGSGVQEDSKWVDYVLDMLEVDYVALAPGDSAIEEVKAEASVVLVVYDGRMELATVHVTNSGRVLAETPEGSLWYAYDPGVDTVLICAAMPAGEVES